MKEDKTQSGRSFLDVNMDHTTIQDNSCTFYMMSRFDILVSEDKARFVRSSLVNNEVLRNAIV